MVYVSTAEPVAVKNLEPVYSFLYTGLVICVIDTVGVSANNISAVLSRFGAIVAVVFQRRFCLEVDSALPFTSTTAVPTNVMVQSPGAVSGYIHIPTLTVPFGSLSRYTSV